MPIKATRAARNKEYICNNCHFIGHGQMKRKGSGWLESLIWIVLLIPGPIYSLWRYNTRHLVCPKCHGYDLIRLDTPPGQEIFEKSLSRFR